MYFALIMFMLMVIGGVTDQFYTTLNNKVDAPYKHTLAPQAQAYRTALQRYLAANPNVGGGTIAGTDLDPYMPAGYVRNPLWNNAVNNISRRFVIFIDPGDARTFDPNDVKIRNWRNIEGELAEIADYSTYAGGTSFETGKFRSPVPILAAEEAKNYWTDYSIGDSDKIPWLAGLPPDSPFWIGSY